MHEYYIIFMHIVLTYHMCTVKSCIKAAAYGQFFHFSGRLLYKTSLCTAVVQLLAAYTVQSMHAESQHRVFYT